MCFPRIWRRPPSSSCPSGMQVPSWPVFADAILTMWLTSSQGGRDIQPAVLSRNMGSNWCSPFPPWWVMTTSESDIHISGQQILNKKVILWTQWMSRCSAILSVGEGAMSRSEGFLVWTRRVLEKRWEWLTTQVLGWYIHSALSPPCSHWKEGQALPLLLSELCHPGVFPCTIVKSLTAKRSESADLSC